MADTPQEYLAAAPEAGRPWLEEFWAHVRERNPDLELAMFRSTPMFRFGPSYAKDGYVMFTTAAKHFSAHALEFDLVAETKEKIPGVFGGKGCVSVKYDNEAAKPVLKEFVDEAMRRRGFLSRRGWSGRDSVEYWGRRGS